ncbi:MAG: histidine kinase, partial [Pseudomonadota bacterium]
TTQRSGLGLLGIRERVSSLGGEFSLRRLEGEGGTELRIVVPKTLPAQDDGAHTTPYAVAAPG